MEERREEILRIALRLPLDMWTRLERKLDQAVIDPRADGRKILIELGLDRDGKPTWRGTRVQGPWEYARPPEQRLSR